MCGSLSLNCPFAWHQNWLEVLQNRERNECTTCCSRLHPQCRSVLLYMRMTKVLQSTARNAADFYWLLNVMFEIIHFFNLNRWTNIQEAVIINWERTYLISLTDKLSCSNRTARYANNIAPVCTVILSSAYLYVTIANNLKLDITFGSGFIPPVILIIASAKNIFLETTFFVFINVRKVMKHEGANNYEASECNGVIS